MISIPGPFVLSLSKASPELVEGGEQRVFPQPVKIAGSDPGATIGVCTAPHIQKLPAPVKAKI